LRTPETSKASGRKGVRWRHANGSRRGKPIGRGRKQLKMATQPFATAIETPQLSYIRTFKESSEEIPYRRLWIHTKSAALAE